MALDKVIWVVININIEHTFRDFLNNFSSVFKEIDYIEVLKAFKQINKNEIGVKLADAFLLLYALYGSIETEVTRENMINLLKYNMDKMCIKEINGEKQLVFYVNSN